MARCAVCGDKGLVRVKYHGGEPDEFALCLCASGMAWRNDQNTGRQTYPLWHVWAAREQVEHDRVGPIEDFYEPEEIAGMFPAPLPSPRTELHENAIIAAVKTRRGKL